MTNLELANKLINIATEEKTTYVLGGWGQPLTPANKIKFKLMYAKNRDNKTIADGIAKADSNTYAFDCNCLVKSVINGWKNFNTHKPIEDNGSTIDWMLANCTEVSTDMSKIEIGEYLAFKDKSHCGVYVGIIDGKRMAVECTYRWNNGVQLININREERKDMWGYHGKLKWVNFPTAKDLHNAELKVAVNTLVDARKGIQSKYVQLIQYALVDRGCKYVDPVGYFGDDTEKAVKDFQAKNNIKSTGVVDLDTINALLK